MLTGVDQRPPGDRLLGLVSWLSMSWSFTEDCSEYFALLLWSTVGMMLLVASDELLRLF